MPLSVVIVLKLITQKPRENGFWVMGSSREWFRTGSSRQSGLIDPGCGTRLMTPIA
ncbi:MULTISPECIES: hypothetical protein [Rhizobium/Agrobacterium group]|jgi:hypothetical protein|uniref:Uncharacterized protein n=1 Tax=Agrobacterium tumefaciens TaxID=358 RepID=A0A8A8Z861_AGRTU|nr:MULTISPECIES: hypothetical protein [Rhizobium/Agrobacterium group]MDP9560681.1 hypothetical protein [Rhizobium nepotum]MBO9109091.1 hypothetical protein [Agrobacterium sp. S2/73]MDH7805282.1 hypothetical protein [Rhizobium sp. AN67]MDP9759768.1 hypothetical protein [Agrobacterium tumefaciens]MDQ1222948.1 hypothetical protein [Agrobacterium sp. SORGH_AS_0745]